MNLTKKLIKNAIAAIAVIACVGLTSCVKNPNPDGPGENGADKPNEFSFSTKKTVNLTLKYDVPAGYRVQFEMYSTSPLKLDEYKSYVKDSTLIPFLSGRTDQTGKVSFKGDLPVAVNEIYVYSTGIGVPVLMRASVGDDGVVSEFKTADVKATPLTRAGGSPSGTSTWKTYNITLNTPTLPSVSMTIPQSDKELIDKSFQENQNYDLVKTYYRPCIELEGDANVKIYSVKHGANSNRTNALAYFVYNKEKISPDDINSNLQLAFPELTKTVPAEGTGYQLLNGTETTFKAGSRIGFALLPDITPGNIKTENAQILYSYFGNETSNGTWNTYTYPGLSRANAPHMVISLLRQSADGHAILAIGFEDQPFSTQYGTNRGNFRDDMFIVEIDPASSLPDDLPTPPKEEPSYDTEFTTSGIFCFEDCWPNKGDYDLNDVVIAYKNSILYSYTTGYVGLKDKFTFLNNGAAFTNGFGYQLLGLSQSNISKCTVKCDQADYSWDKQGLDQTASSNEAIIMLFDNGKSIKKGTTFDVITYFTSGSVMVGVNPFIVVKTADIENILSKDRIEVHLPTTTKAMSAQFLPTSKARTSLFGQYDDKSKPSEKLYYVRTGNYPFALDVKWDSSKHGEATNFVVPAEMRIIDETYPKFKNWVDSKGTKDTEWYLHPNK